MLKIKAPILTPLSRAEARELTRTLRTLALTALYQRGLGIVILATALLFALMNPSNLATFGFWALFLIFLGLSIGIFGISLIVSIPLYVKATQRGCPTAYFWLVNATILSLIKALYVFFLKAPIPHASPLIEYATSFTIHMIIYSCATYIFLEVLRERIETTFHSFGLSVDTRSTTWQTPPPAQPSAVNQNLRKIRAIQVEDKYLKIYTDTGVHQLTQSLSAATENLDDSLGMRVHRSVWLSWQEMTQITYENGNPRMVGQSGQIWPVSRNKVPEIKQGMARFQATVADTTKLAAQ